MGLRELCECGVVGGGGNVVAGRGVTCSKGDRVRVLKEAGGVLQMS